MKTDNTDKCGIKTDKYVFGTTFAMFMGAVAVAVCKCSLKCFIHF